MITVDHFFDLLLKELELNPDLKGYYRFLNKPSLFNYRKAYYCQRLQYIADHITDTNSTIFDLGCGYGTTGLFLALNGFKVTGNTIEFYSDQIAKRREYWSQYGSIDGLTIKHEDIFDNPPAENAYNYIIVQDVLHHLEPINNALQIINKSLKQGGKLIVVEENGLNLLNRFKLFIQRGNKRIITIHDKKLNKDILLGNENIRSKQEWNNILKNNNLHIDFESVDYIRYFLPNTYKKIPISNIIKTEKTIWQNSEFKKKYFFHGLNFIAIKK